MTVYKSLHGLLPMYLFSNLHYCWQMTPVVCWYRVTVSTNNKDHARDEEFPSHRSSHREQFTNHLRSTTLSFSTLNNVHNRIEKYMMYSSKPTGRQSNQVHTCLEQKMYCGKAHKIWTMSWSVNTMLVYVSYTCVGDLSWRWLAGCSNWPAYRPHLLHHWHSAAAVQHRRTGCLDGGLWRQADDCSSQRSRFVGHISPYWRPCANLLSISQMQELLYSCSDCYSQETPFSCSWSCKGSLSNAVPVSLCLSVCLSHTASWKAVSFTAVVNVEH